MRKIIAVLLGLSVSSWAVGAISGNTLMEWVPSFKRVQSDSATSRQDYTQAGELRGYIIGAKDSLGRQNLVCVPIQVKDKELVKIVIEYLEANPDKRDESGEIVVFNSLEAIYDCN